eukprot:1143616-Pelagomonas_calceolata.AAC.6
MHVLHRRRALKIPMLKEISEGDSGLLIVRMDACNRLVVPIWIAPIERNKAALMSRIAHYPQSIYGQEHRANSIPYIPAGQRAIFFACILPYYTCSRWQAHAWGNEKLAKAATGGVANDCHPESCILYICALLGDQATMQLNIMVAMLALALLLLLKALSYSCANAAYNLAYPRKEALKSGNYTALLSHQPCHPIKQSKRGMGEGSLLDGVPTEGRGACLDKWPTTRQIYVGLVALSLPQLLELTATMSADCWVPPQCLQYILELHGSLH